MLFERRLYAWRARLRALFDGDRVDRELDDELRHHVAREIEARRARGIPPAEARRQTLAALGGLAPTREHVRGSRFGAARARRLSRVPSGRVRMVSPSALEGQTGVVASANDTRQVVTVWTDGRARAAEDRFRCLAKSTR